MPEEKRVVKEEPEIRSAHTVHGMRMLEHQVKAMEQLVHSYVKAGKPLPPKLKLMLSSLRTNTLALQRLKGREKA